MHMKGTGDGGVRKRIEGQAAGRKGDGGEHNRGGHEGRRDCQDRFHAIVVGGTADRRGLDAGG